MKIIYIIFSLSVVALIVSCSSMISHEQRIKLSSNPPGASVYYNGKLIGTTPNFFNIHRSTRGQLVLKKEGFKDYTLKLDSSYRWRESFFPNFVFFYGAPIGWGVDLLTKSAWDYEKVKPEDFPTLTYQNKALAKKQAPSQLVIAIAPPQSKNQQLSDEAAKKILISLKQKYPTAIILPLEKKWKTFLDYDYTYESETDKQYKDDLFDALDATHLAKSKITTTSNKATLAVSVINIFTEKPEFEFTEYYDSEDIYIPKYTRLASWFYKSLNLLPNAVGLDFIRTKHSGVFYTDDGLESYEAKKEPPSPILRYLSSISLSSIPNPRTTKAFGFIFRFTPSYLFTYRESFLTGAHNQQLDGTKIKTFAFAAGIGPELGFAYVLGYTFMRIGFDIGYQQTTATLPNREASDSGLQNFNEVEFGHSFFISKNLNLKLFSKSGLDTSYRERRALNGLGHKKISRDSRAFELISGLNISYLLPEGKVIARKALK